MSGVTNTYFRVQYQWDGEWWALEYKTHRTFEQAKEAAAEDMAHRAGVTGYRILRVTTTEEIVE